MNVNGKTILIVDDEAPIRTVLERILEREGYRTRTAPDGTKALEEARAFPPDLVLLDLTMPGMDGLEVLRRLRGSPETRQTLVLVLTARQSIEDEVEGLYTGADDYLPKPFEANELKARIGSLLRRGARTDGPGGNP